MGFGGEEETLVLKVRALCEWGHKKDQYGKLQNAVSGLL